MKKIAILILSILIAGLFVACNQDITVDAQTYANMEVGTFVLNGQNYATLQAAVDAIGSKAAGDNVIYLTKNASGPGAKIANKDVTIDFQGYTYSFTNVNGLQGQDVTGKDFGLSITTGSDVVLKGLQKIDLNDKTTTDLTMVYVEGVATSLTIEDAPKMEVANSQYVFWAANGATLTIGSNSETAPTTISGKMAATGTGDSKPVVTVNNATEMNVAELKADNAVVVVNTSANTTVSSFIASNDATVVVSGPGSVTVEKNDSPADADYEVQNTSSSATVKIPTTNSSGEATETTIDPGKQIDVEEGKTTADVPQPSTAVARIGAELYGTLSEAVNVANISDSKLTVVILKDIEIAGSIIITNSMVIDGSSHTITTEGTATSGSMAAFDIYDTSAVAPISIDVQDISVVSTKHARVFLINGDYCTYENPNVLNAKNVMITTDGEAFYANGPTVINAKECNLTHDGVYLSDKDPVYYSAIIVGYNGTINIYDSEITSFGNGAATFPSGGTVNIYNTDITSLDDTVAGLTGYLFWARHEKSYDTGAYKDYCGSAIINVFSGSNSGKFRITDDGHTSANRVSEINVYDGVFNDVSFVVDGAGASNDSIVITGGIYSSNPSAYVAGGFIAEYDSETQLWTVVEDTPEVKITKDGEEDKTMSLASFRNKVNAGNSYARYTVTLLDDVDLKGIEWTPIGTTSNPFSGVFDGDGKTISNYTISSASGDDGLFGVVKGEAQEVDYKGKWDFDNYSFNYSNLGEEYTAIIKNLTVNNAKVTTTSSKKATGAVIGSATYATISNITVNNSTIVGEKGVGGVIGSIDGSYVENCTSDSLTSVLARVYNAGGVIGITANTNSGNVNQPSMIYNCSNYATVTLNGTRGYAGGVLGNGQNGNNNVIADCHNFGKIKAANTNTLTSPASENSGIAGITGSANGVYLLLNCVNEGTASFEVVTDGEGVEQNFFNSVAGISFYGSGRNYCNCINKASFSVAANKIAGITVAENTILKGCLNEGNLVNTLIPSAVYELSSDMKVINIENINFESISQLNEEITKQFNSVGNAVNVSLKNVTINNQPGTGTLIVPYGIQAITSNTKVCDDVQLNDSLLVNINMHGLNQFVSGAKTLCFGGSDNTITVSNNASMNKVVLRGNNNHVINNGTLHGVQVIEDGVGFTITNNGTLGHLSIVGSTASVELTNNSTINNTNGNAIHVEAECALTINTYGTISSSSFAMLLYDGCDVTINAYSTSVTTGGFAPYRGNNSIRVYYQNGATLNNDSWLKQASTQYHVVVSEMEQ